MTNGTEEALRERLASLGVKASDAAVSSSLTYFDLLSRWNGRTNLTGFDLSRPGVAALDRILVEPLAAASLLTREDRCVVDIGTGSGSPAVPLQVACPWLRAVWFEARWRKVAFLREVVRVLALRDVEVRGERFEARTSVSGPVDVVTVRAVRVDSGALHAVRVVCGAGVRVLVFGNPPPGVPGIGVEEHGLWSGGPRVAVLRFTEIGQ